jgi:bacterioferritin-associated ferredoxin
MRDLKEGLGVGTGCGRCTSCAKSVLREAKKEISCNSTACADGFGLQAA